MFNKVLI